MSNLRSTKLFSALEDLPKAKRSAFRQFVQREAPQNPILIELLHQLEPLFDHSNGEETIAEFAEKLYGSTDKKTYNSDRSDLFKHLRRFLVREKFENDCYREDVYWAEICAEHGWEKWMPELPPKEAFQAGGGHKAFANALEVAMVRNSFFSGHQYHTGDTGLDDVQQSLDAYILLQKLKYTCAEANKALTSGQVHPVPIWLEGLLAEVGKRGALPGIVEAYKRALYSMQQQAKGDKAGADLHFQALMDQLNLHPDLEQEEAIDLYTYALNHLIRSSNAGSGDPADIYTTITEMINKGVLSQGGLLSPRYFKLITSALCKQGLLDKAEEFVRENERRLLEETRKRYRAYNLAVVAFHRGKWREARKLLWEGSSRFKDRYYDLGSRIYLCKIDFFLEDWEMLATETESFRLLLHRLGRQGKLSKETKAQMDQLRKYSHRAAQVMQMSPAKKKKGLAKLISDLRREPDQLPTHWLLKALDKNNKGAPHS